MKLRLSAANFYVSLTNTKDEPIYIHKATALNVELDIAKLVESIDEIQQTVLAAMEETFTEPTPPEA